jgi:aspartyl-tRNA(Asn)/glutamyl-tRNA(Gln) amidotransferase subunit B
MPGVLPVLNKKAVEHTLAMGMALECKIAGEAGFDRKHYFYPDLPKNYQISEFGEPLASGGKLELSGTKKMVRIRRVHLEEDTGKNLHAEDTGVKGKSLIDFNRSGVPLMEIVTEPDIGSVEEAEDYMNSLKEILLYLNISDCKMQEGSIRFEANVSVAREDSSVKGVKVEIKNLNSFRSVTGSVIYEIERQTKLLEEGKRITAETRLWDEKLKMTRLMRTKEEAHDYRYFPEPDLVPVAMASGWIEEIKKRVPELPQKKRERFVQAYGLPPYDAGVLISSPDLASLFEKTVKITSRPKIVSNWIMGEVRGALKEKREEKIANLTPEKLAGLLSMVIDGRISGKIAKEVLPLVLETGKDPQKIVKERGLLQIGSRDDIENVVKEVLKENEKVANEYKDGKAKALTFLVGQVMGKTKGRANPKLVNEILKELLKL